VGMKVNLARYGAVAIAAVLAMPGTSPVASFAAEPQGAAQPDSNGSVSENGALTISESDAITTVIERFVVGPERQYDAIAKVKAASVNWTRDKQFLGFVLLRSREKSGGIAIYSQWSRRDNEVVAEKPDDTRSMRTVLKDYELLDSDNFAVAFTGQAPALQAPSQASLSATPLAHFGLFRIAPADYDELIRRAKAYGPNSFRVNGLRAINFHRSASGRFVVNFGLWDSFEHFADLQKAPGFAQQNQYYVGLADFRPDFFDVVAVVSNDQ
jgi:heme-degrading monooxygenase HmoA